jgi:hypothetical protein
MSTPATPPPGIDAFHRERSKCIDAFSKLESEVVILLGIAGHSCGSEHFGQKLALLKNAKANPKLSKARLAKVHELLRRCEALAEIRNDIVHSVLQLADIGGTNKACFINMRYCQSGSQSARLFTLGGLRELSAEMEKLAEDLRGTAPTKPG